MGFFDLFGGRERVLTLDVVSLESWPDKLVRHQGLHDVLSAFVADVEARKEALEAAKKRLADPRLREKAVPERARPVYDEHLPVLVEAVDDLLSQPVVESVFLVEDLQEDFREAVAAFHDRSRKGVAALKEFLGAELKAVHDAVKALEDEVIALTPQLEKRGFDRIQTVKSLVEEYKGSRGKERKLQELRDTLDLEIESLEARRLKIKSKIQYYMERAQRSEFKELLAQEEDVLREMDRLKVKHASADWDDVLKPLRQRLSQLRREMINDVTALNINEQRAFLESVKDDLLVRKRKLERVDDLLGEVSFQTYRKRFREAVEPFRVRIEDADVILESEEEDVALQ